MSILGSALGRALSGAAGAAGVMANKYIDDEIATMRAQALADIQRVTAGKIREDDDAFANDPTRVARDRARKKDDVLAASGAAREAELAGLNDPAYQGAKRTKAQDDAAAARREKVADIEATTPAEAKRQGLMSEAQARAQAKYREPRADTEKALDEKVRAIEKALGRPLSEQEKLLALGLAKSVARDPELDTETITTEEIQPDGSVKKVQRKQVRRPGQPAEAGPTDDPIKAAMDKARADRAAAAQQKPAAAAKTAQPAAQPAAQGDPLAGKSRAQVREIEARTRTELSRWENKPGAEARVAELRALLERIANGQY